MVPTSTTVGTPIAMTGKSSVLALISLRALPTPEPGVTSMMRPAAGLGGDSLPVAGLFLGGAGIHPGGGVNGLPGRIAASRVNRFLAR